MPRAIVAASVSKRSLGSARDTGRRFQQRHHLHLSLQVETVGTVIPTNRQARIYLDAFETIALAARRRQGSVVSVYQPSTRNKRHLSGRPVSSWSPRSTKWRSDPTTRSTTVRDTRTSPGSASA